MEAAYPKSRSPFLEQVRAAIRVRHYSVRTERAYIDWIVRFIHFHDRRHPGLEPGHRTRSARASDRRQLELPAEESN
jgi:hypothetical protein